MTVLGECAYVTGVLTLVRNVHIIVAASYMTLRTWAEPEPTQHEGLGRSVA